MAKIRVLVVDDSVFLRRTLPRLLQTDPDIEVIATAADGAEGLELVKSLRPDVVTLDVMMPVMDGLTALKRIMREAPTPVIMVSSVTREGEPETLEALEEGAVDFVTKPSGPISLDIDKVRQELIDKVKIAQSSRLKVAAHADMVRNKFRSLVQNISPIEVAKPRLPNRIIADRPTPHSKKLIAVASSTGGPAALQILLSSLPADLNAGIVIVQHIAPGFTKLLADRLNSISPLTVVEAQDRQLITPGVALLSPADHHLTVVRGNQGLMVRLKEDAPDTRYRPSAEVLYRSIADCCPSLTCAVIMTGMGDDGAAGMLAIHSGGGYTIAQDEASCLIFGMSRRAIEMGGVDVVLPLDQIAQEIVRATQVRSSIL